MRALYTSFKSHTLVILHPLNSNFQFLHPRFARDMVRWIEFQFGPDWLDTLLPQHSTDLDIFFGAGISRFGTEHLDMAWVDIVGGGVSEGLCVSEASAAQLCEAVANLEAACTSKQHLVCVDGGMSVVGTSIFAGSTSVIMYEAKLY